MLTIPSVIDNAQREVILQALAEATFVDGKLTAGDAAKRVKSNQELDQAGEISGYLSKIIIGNLYNNPVFRSAALPNSVSTPIIAKYTRGMKYGDHIDDPVMGEGPRFRCDIASTVFLNSPEDYEGGELVVNTAFGQQKVKLPAGDAVIYPASSLHHVAEVTKGERIVAVTWIQSLVREPEKRAILHDLNTVREKMLIESPDNEDTARIDHSYTNLVRMWAEV
jgi:PKHD-type hydroxylase